MLYLAIKNTTRRVVNPYYTYNNARLEAEYVDEPVTENIFFLSDKQLEKFVQNNAKLTEKKAIRYYEINEIFPRVEITTKLSIDKRVGAKVCGVDRPEYS